MPPNARHGSSSGVRVFWAPDRTAVLDEVDGWAQEVRHLHPEVRRVGLFGSYARNQQTPGSDLDILILVSDSPERVWFMRGGAYDVNELSLPADVFVYTEAEAAHMEETSAWFQHVLAEVLWLASPDPA